LGLLGVSVASFEQREQEAFKESVATVSGVGANQVVITSVTGSRRLINSASFSSSVTVAFNVLVVIPSTTNVTAAAVVNTALTSKLTASIASGNFVNTLQAVSTQIGATALSSASASGLSSGGFSQTVTKTVSPSTVPTRVPVSVTTSSSTGVNTAVVAGAVVGVLGGITLIVGTVVLCYYRSKRQLRNSVNDDSSVIIVSPSQK